MGVGEGTIRTVWKVFVGRAEGEEGEVGLGVDWSGCRRQS